MPTRCKLIVGAILLILLAACGGAESAATPVSSAVDAPAPTDTRPAPGTGSPTPTLAATPTSPLLAPTFTAIPANPDISAAAIAFTSARDGNMEIYLMEMDGSAVHRLTTNPAEDYWPTWSPDGAQIAFASDREGSFEIFILSIAEVLENAGNYEPHPLT